MSLLKPKDAATALGVSTAQLTKLTIAGELPSINVGRGTKKPARRYDPADITAFIATRRTIECRSTSAPARTRTNSTSGIGVIDFVAEQAKRTSGKR